MFWIWSWGHFHSAVNWITITKIYSYGNSDSGRGTSGDTWQLSMVWRTPWENHGWYRGASSKSGFGQSEDWCWSVPKVCQCPSKFCRTGPIYTDDQSRDYSEVGQGSIEPVTQGYVHGHACTPDILNITHPSMGSEDPHTIDGCIMSYKLQWSNLECCMWKSACPFINGVPLSSCGVTCIQHTLWSERTTIFNFRYNHRILIITKLLESCGKKIFSAMYSPPSLIYLLKL